MVGHEILMAVTATVGVLLVLTAPMAVSLGLSGALIAIAASFVVMLRTRQYRSGSEVLAGLTAGVLGLIPTAAAALALPPDWRAPIAVVLPAAGALVLTSRLVPSTPPVRTGPRGHGCGVRAE